MSTETTPEPTLFTNFCLCNWDMLLNVTKHHGVARLHKFGTTESGLRAMYDDNAEPDDTIADSEHNVASEPEHDMDKSSRWSRGVVDLDLWVAHILVPALRDADCRAEDDTLLASAAVFAWLWADGRSALPPSDTELIRFGRAVLFDQPDPTASRAKRRKHAERPLSNMVDRALAYGAGWRRGISDPPWSRVIAELNFVLHCFVRGGLKRLWATAHEIGAKMRDELGYVRTTDKWVMTFDSFCQFTRYGAQIAAKLVAPTFDGNPLPTRRRELAGWDEMNSTFSEWLWKQCIGISSGGKRIMAYAFSKGWLWEELKCDSAFATNLAYFESVALCTCWNPECVKKEQYDRKNKVREPFKRTRRAYFEGGTCDYCKWELVRNVFVTQKRIAWAPSYEKHPFSKCMEDPEHFVRLDLGQKAVDGRCPLHPACRCSQGTSELWMQKPSDGEIPQNRAKAGNDELNRALRAWLNLTAEDQILESLSEPVLSVEDLEDAVLVQLRSSFTDDESQETWRYVTPPITRGFGAPKCGVEGVALLREDSSGKRCVVAYCIGKTVAPRPTRREDAPPYS